MKLIMIFNVLIVTLMSSVITYANQDLDLAVDQWLAGITTQIEFEKKVQDLNINQKISSEDFEMIQIVYEQKQSQPTIKLKPYESLPIAFNEPTKLSVNENKINNMDSQSLTPMYQNKSNIENPRAKYWVIGILSAVVLSIYMQDKKVIIYK